MRQLTSIAAEIAQDVGASPENVEAELDRYHNEFRVSLEASKRQVRKDFGGSLGTNGPATPSEDDERDAERTEKDGEEGDPFSE